MALIHQTKVFAVQDFALYKLLTDPAGAPTTWGAKVDVPGIKSLAVARVYNGKELRGDSQLLDADAILERVTLKLAYTKLAFDVESIIGGHLITDSGVTPNQKTVLKVDSADVVNYWKFEAQCLRADLITGDVHIIGYKCKITGNFDMGMTEEDYQLYGLDATSMKTAGTGGWLDEIYNETAVAIV